jgi:uncharacterized protein
MSSLTQNSPQATHLTRLKAYADQHPLEFSVVVTLTIALLISIAGILMPQPADDYPLAVLAYDGMRYALAIGLLSALGWWKRAGFKRKLTWRGIVPFLPMTLFPFLLLLIAKPGTNDPLRIFLIIETAFAAGFTEEALFRGVVLRALQPTGWIRAAILSSIMFGLLHIAGLLVGANPLYIGLQVFWAILFGFSLAAPVLVTRLIWPAIFLHFVINAISTLSQGSLVNTKQPDAAALSSLLVLIVLFALLASYGYWLLRRYVHKLPERS